MWLLSFLLIAFITLSSYYILKTNKSLKYWQTRGIVTLEPHNYIFGNIKNVLFGRENLATTITNAYFHLKSTGHKYGGMYFMNRPIFVPTDPQLVRNIMVRDFDHFVDRGIESDSDKQPLSAHLFNLNGDEWKLLRQKLTSTFTSGKLKGMMEILQLHADELISKIQLQNSIGLELNQYFEQVGIDIIGHVAFGLNCNTLSSQQSHFYAMTKRIFKPKFVNILKFLVAGNFSNPGNVILLTTSDEEMCDFFLNLIKDTVEHRNQHKDEKKKDFLQLLIDLNTNKHQEKGLSVEQIAAQTFLFFIAAFETSSKALNFTMYELSKNTRLQNELRREIRENVKDFNYDEIMQNKLLDLIVKETLRKYPSVVFLHRKCTKRYQLMNSVKPQIALDEGTILLIPIYAFHNDPEYFPQPELYDPYRFDDVGQRKIDPLTYFPFGDGPRNCIGMRFGLLQVKLIIAKLIANFEFAPSPLTQEPFEFNPITDNLLLTFKNRIYFNVNCNRT